MPTGIYERTKKGRENLSKAHTGQKAWNKGIKGEESHVWIGDDIGCSGVHNWIRKLGQPTKCEICGRDGLTGCQIHWANKNHTYKRNREDWMRLCAKCHKKYDNEFNSSRR